MGTKIIKIKRFPTEKCSDFMAGYTKRRKPKMKTKQNVSRIFSSACQNRIAKKKGRIRDRNAALPYYFGSVYGLITINYKLSIHGDILVHVLAANQRIVEHIGHGQQINEIAGHVTHDVGEEVLYDGQYATTYDHHHEDTRSLGSVFAKSLGSEVEDTCPHHRRT